MKTVQGLPTPGRPQRPGPCVDGVPDPAAQLCPGPRDAIVPNG